MATAICEYGSANRRMILFAVSLIFSAGAICGVGANSRIVAAERLALDATQTAKANAAAIQSNREFSARIDERLQAISAGVQRIERQLSQERDH